MGALLVERGRGRTERTALLDGGTVWTYGDLHRAVEAVRARLIPLLGDEAEPRVCALLAPGPRWVAAQWGTWRAGGVWVPLAVSHPERELAYVLEDARPSAVLVDAAHAIRLGALCAARGLPVVTIDDGGAPPAGAAPPALAADRAAMILYTSGTTDRPKGVVSTHGAIRAQVDALIDAWGWTPDDRILHVLPLHHVHGIINALSCALGAGASCAFAHPFDADGVWDRLAEGDITLFMAVPTIYRRLIQAWEAASSDRRRRWSGGAASLRLMVSGSAALPVPVLERWQEMTGQVLLERYGMTEIGMGLSNPLHGERRPGTVGVPLPGVAARLVDEQGTPLDEGKPGQIEIRGPQLFREYWQRPDATRAAFHDGWFRTGDEAVVEDGYFRILGRQSVDIIKSGGYKISALEIEAVLREHERIAECAVVGLPDPEWGERVAAAVVTAGDEALELETLRAWAKERLAPYKIPRALIVTADLPRNAMGKVVKPEIRTLFEEHC